MKLQYRILGKRRRKRVRDIACTAWTDTQCDTNAAEHLARMRIQDQMYGIITSLLISIAIKLAVELIHYWVAESIPEPGLTFKSGEPGFDGVRHDAHDQSLGESS